MLPAWTIGDPSGEPETLDSLAPSYGDKPRSWPGTLRAARPTASAELVNLLIKAVQRTGHGYQDFDNRRIGMPSHWGVDRQEQPAARVGRTPTALSGVRALQADVERLVSLAVGDWLVE